MNIDNDRSTVLGWSSAEGHASRPIVSVPPLRRTPSPVLFFPPLRCAAGECAGVRPPASLSPSGGGDEGHAHHVRHMRECERVGWSRRGDPASLSLRFVVLRCRPRSAHSAVRGALVPSPPLDGPLLRAASSPSDRAPPPCHSSSIRAVVRGTGSSGVGEEVRGVRSEAKIHSPGLRHTSVCT